MVTHYLDRPGRCAMLAFVACAAGTAQEELSQKIGQLLKQAEGLRAGSPEEARKQLAEALDRLDQADPKFASAAGMQCRWKCGQIAWGFDSRIGLRAWRDVLRYFDQDGGKLLGDPEQLGSCQQARGFLAALHEQEHSTDKALTLRRAILEGWKKANAKVDAAVARAELGQAIVLLKPEDGLSGLKELEQAYQALCRDARDDPRLAWVARIYANMLVDMGLDLDERVLDCQERALAIYSSKPPQNPADLINLKWETANSLQKRLRLQEARKLAQDAFTSAEQTFGSDHVQTVWPRGFYGRILYSMGDVEGALGLRKICVDICERELPKKSLQRLVTLNNYGYTLMGKGQYREASEAFEKGVDAADPRDRTPFARGSLALAYDNLGKCYAELGMADKAVELLRAAMQRVEFDQGLVRYQVLGGLAMALQRTGREKELADAAVMFAESVPFVVAVSGNYDQSTRYLKRQALTLAEIGKVREKDLQKCLENLLDLARRAQLECYTLPGRPSYVLARIADDAAQTVLSLAGRTPTRSSLEGRAFEALESLRGIELRVTSMATRLSKRPGGSPIAESQRNAWAARAELARLGSLGKGTTAEILDKALQRDRHEFDALFAALKGADKQVVDVTIDGVARNLPKDAVAVAFRVVSIVEPDPKRKGHETRSERLEAHVVTRVKDKGRFERVPLGPPGPIRAAAERWVAAIVGGAHRAPGESLAASDPAAELDKRVLAQFKDKLGGAKVLVLCLDDQLHEVPFELLPGAKGLEVRHAVSLADLDPVPAPVAGAPSLFVVGGLDFDNRPDAEIAPGSQPGAVGVPTGAARGPTPVWTSTVKVADMRFRPLEGTRIEADNIAKMFTKKFGQAASLKTGRAVSREGFIASVQKARFLHLATHGYFLRPAGGDASDRDRTVRGFAPMSLCGLALSGAQATGDSFLGVVTGEELATLDLSACQLAVLSACDTYLGEVHAGHGLASLQGALHAAGARVVVASRWKVPDNAASELMQKFYDYLWNVGLRPREALAKAKGDLSREQGFKEIRNWGAFVLTGDLKD